MNKRRKYYTGYIKQNVVMDELSFWEMVGHVSYPNSYCRMECAHILFCLCPTIQSSEGNAIPSLHNGKEEQNHNDNDHNSNCSSSSSCGSSSNSDNDDNDNNNYNLLHKHHNNDNRDNANDKNDAEFGYNLNGEEDEMIMIGVITMITMMINDDNDTEINKRNDDNNNYRNSENETNNNRV